MLLSTKPWVGGSTAVMILLWNMDPPSTAYDVDLSSVYVPLQLVTYEYW